MNVVRKPAPLEQAEELMSDDDLMRMLLDGIPADVVAENAAEHGRRGVRNAAEGHYSAVAGPSGIGMRCGTAHGRKLPPPARTRAGAGQAQPPQKAAPDKAGDPVFEATVETFRRSQFPIRQDDETYVVMQFMYIAMRNMEATFAAERRAEMDRLISLMRGLNERNEQSAAALRALLSEQQAAAESLGKRLMWTAKEAASRFSTAFTQLHQDALVKMNQYAQAMVGSAEDDFDKKLRKLVREEAQIGLASGIQAEVGGLAEGVRQATATLERASAIAATRAGKGWLVNLFEDLAQLPAVMKVGLAATLVVVVAVLVIR